MANNLEKISYTLVTIASVCFVSGLLVLVGGEPSHGNIGEIYIYDRQYSKH